MNTIWHELDGGCLLARIPVRKIRRAPPQKSSAPSDLVMTFGKWKGASVAAVVEHDPHYVSWLLGQGWFPERYPVEAACIVEYVSANNNPDTAASPPRAVYARAREGFCTQSPAEGLGNFPSCPRGPKTGST